MLDKTSRKLLKFVTKNEPNMKGRLFTFDYVGEACGLSKNEAFECIYFLEELGLLRCVYMEPFGPDGARQLYGFTASHKGRHKAEFDRLELYSKILESVLLPILVSIVTAIWVST